MTDRRDDEMLAFDLHGRLVHCVSCGAEMEDATVNHRKHGKPQCDRCYWDEYHERHLSDTDY